MPDKIFLVIHGIVGEGYDISSIWDSDEKAQVVLRDRVQREGRYELVPSGVYARTMSDGKREYLDVIARLVHSDLEAFFANIKALQRFADQRRVECIESCKRLR